MRLRRSDFRLMYSELNSQRWLISGSAAATGEGFGCQWQAHTIVITGTVLGHSKSGRKIEYQYLGLRALSQFDG
jgi:hypothetical protein